MRFPTILLFSILPFLSGAFIETAPQSSRITVEGYLQCVGESGVKPATYPCQEKGERFALKDAGGGLYFFSPEDPRALIFQDPRVFRRRLRIEGLPRGAAASGEKEDRGYLEITDLHAVENGKLIRLYYHCDVCNIDSYAPGPCWCCQREFEFREKEVDRKP